jgi:predicted dehydrogenase
LQFHANLLCTLTWVYLPGVKNYQEQYSLLSPSCRISLEFPSPYLKHFPTKLSIQDMEGEKMWHKQVTVSYQEAFHEELRHFHHCVVSGTEPITGLAEAIKDAETVARMATKAHLVSADRT